MNLTNTLRRSETLPSQNHEDVIYRSVSPHGHVYWEIDPNQVYGGSHTNNNHFHNEESVALLQNHQSYNQQQATTEKQAVANNQRPATNNQETASSNQLPATNN